MSSSRPRLVLATTCADRKAATASGRVSLRSVQGRTAELRAERWARLLSRSDAGRQHAGVLYQEQAKAAGIALNIVREPNDGYWDNVWLKKPWVASYWGGRPTCDWFFTVVYAKGAAWNETKWANPRFNELLVAARSQTDDKKRAPMYAEMQQLVHDDGGAIVLVFNNYVDAHSKKVAHGQIAANWEADGLKIAERWWFA